MKRYENLHLVPSLIAREVAMRPYEGTEFRDISAHDRTATEIKRLGMTHLQIQQFVLTVDRRCRRAWILQRPWFVKLVKAKGNTGRDQLYGYAAHWLAGFLRGEP